MPKIKLFASLAQLAGSHEIDIDAATVGELLEAAAHRYGPAWTEQIPHCTVLVNGKGMDPDTERDAPIADGDDVAILPPVAGG